MISKLNQINSSYAEKPIWTTLDYPSNESEAKTYVQNFISRHNLPPSEEIFFDESTKKISVIWRGSDMYIFRQKYPQPFHRDDWNGCPVQKAKFEFSSDLSISLETVFFGRTGWGDAFDSPNFLVQKGTVSCEKDNLLIQIEENFEEADWPENHILYGW